METAQLIPASEWCTHYNVTISFIHSLEEYGLIATTTIEENIFIPSDQLSDLEKYARLHYDLDINLEGIDAISNLLHRIKEMRREMDMLKNKLHIPAAINEENETHDQSN